MFNNYL